MSIGQWLVVVVALLAVALALRRLQPRFINSLVVALALAAIGLAVAFAVQRTRPTIPALTLAWEEALGEELGRAVARAQPAGKDVVVLQLCPQSLDAERRAAAQVAGLTRGLAASGLRIAAVVPGKSADAELFESAGEVPRKVLTAALAGHPEAAALVSFMGAPGPDVPRNMALPPLFAVVERGAEAATPWLRAGVLRLALVPNPQADWRVAPPASATAETLAKLRYRYLWADEQEDRR